MHLNKLIFFLFCLSLTCCKSTEERQPNMIFILVDDLGREWVSCYGAEGIETPVIDQIAQSYINGEDFSKYMPVG